MNQKTKYILLGLGLYLVSAGVAFAAFSIGDEVVSLISPVAEESEAGQVTSFSGEVTGECPLNGMMYPEDQKEAWEKLRPLTVMIENHEDSRPQSGIMRADVVYEAVAEGGITRFLGVYYCKAVESASR